ncbi:MAG: hypothetical protein ACXWM6_04395 [Thermodesulfobacteriota bacterium]
MKKLLVSFFMLGVILGWSAPLRAEMKFSLAILPFIVERVEDPARGAVCPVCGRVYGKGSVLSTAQLYLTRLFQEKIEATGPFKLLPAEKVEEAFSQRDRGRFDLNPMRASIQLGKTLDVDFIFVGFLFRFEQRVGSAIGVDKPASVGFDVHLIRLRDGKMVWTGRFDETQRPLSENLLKMGSFVRRKGQWLTAEELSSVGMDEMLTRFLGLKELEEMP